MCVTRACEARNTLACALACVARIAHVHTRKRVALITYVCVCLCGAHRARARTQQTHFPLYLANMMSTIKAKALQLEPGCWGYSYAFPSVPITCNVEWDLLQQMHPYTLVCTVSLTDSEHTWRNAVRQVWGVQKGTITVEAMRDIVHNLGVPGCKISPTSQAGVLLMSSQALMCRINLSNSSTADVRVLTDIVQKEVEAFRATFIDRALQDEQDIDNLLSLSQCMRVFIS